MLGVLILVYRYCILVVLQMSN